MMYALVGLQGFHILFLALHDWVPLGRWNDTKRVRAANPGNRLLRTTLESTAPYAIGFVASIAYLDRSYPGWLWGWLWVTYLLLFAGEIAAWWYPYCVRSTPERVARYESMFGETYAFLPARNGIRPNSLHVVLHLATVLTLTVLGAKTL